MIYPTAKFAPRTKLFCHPNTTIGDFTFISCDELHMAEGACINRHCEIQGRGKVYIGRYAQVCSYASLVTSSDMPNGSMCDRAPEKYRRIETGDIHIGDHAVVGSYTTVMPGVTLEEESAAYARSYVTHDIPKRMMLTHLGELKPRELDVDLSRIGE